MGILDESIGLNLKSLKFLETSEETYLDHQGRYQGIAYYAVDLTKLKALRKEIVKFVNDSINSLQSSDNSPIDNGIYFTHSRKHYLGFKEREASLFSQGAMFLVGSIPTNFVLVVVCRQYLFMQVVNYSVPVKKK